MRPPRKSRPQGQVRQSQVITTFGPGSMIDLPNQSVIVGGLETWEGVREEIHEPRLVEKLQAHFREQGVDASNLKLMAPPPESDDPSAPRSGITVWQFPEWFVSQITVPYRGGRSRRLVHRNALEKKSGKFIDEDRAKHTVVPIRFVRACSRGHISDIDWKFYAHGGEASCNKRQLWIDESGTSGDLTELRVRCECGEGRSLALAQKNPQLLRTCNGERPWLGLNNREGCGQANRLLIRSASNAYFSQVMSVISLPPKNESLSSAVDGIFTDYLETLDSIEELQFVRRKMAVVKSALGDLTNDEVWREIQIRKGVLPAPEPKSVKQAEFEILSSVQSTTGRDSDTFFAESLPRETWSSPCMADVERIVIVHRLREVVAQLGFTRFEASTPDVEGELQIGVQAAPLARELTWLPAIENRGEGVFIQFQKAAIDEWLKRESVRQRHTRLFAGFDAWRAVHSQSRRKFPGLAYYLLHTISHTLLTAVSLDCGYPASSLRERVYASDSGYGILIYTGTPDSEGTLGGLVDVGRNIHHRFRSALDLAQLCSNDPVCAQHDPTAAREERYLHGAACHGCLLISETSCEQQNDFLDRALIVPTVEENGAEFFPE